MNRLIIHTGGHGVSATDLEHLNDGMFNAIKSLIKGLLSNGTTIPNCILFGCKITSYPGTSIADITAGAVVLDGEICLVDAVIGIDLDVLPDSYVYGYQDSYDAGNPVPYVTGGPKYVHLIRKADYIIVPGAPAADEMSVGTGETLAVVLKKNLFPGVFVWNYIDGVGQPAYINGFVHGWPGTGTTNLRFIKDVANNVRLSGAIDYSPLEHGPFAYPGLQVCQALPVGSRPDRDIETQLTCQLPGGYVTIGLIIRPNGILYANPISFSGGVSYSDIGTGTPFGDFFEMTFTAS